MYMSLEKAMNKPDEPYAMVREGSIDQIALTLVGWSVTDRIEEWVHMEPSRVTTNTSEK